MPILRPETSPRVPASPAATRYQPAMIFMHWLTLALLIAVYAAIELSGAFPEDSAASDAIKTWHYFFGLSVFALVFMRLAVRAMTREVPPITPEPPHWQEVAAHAMHWALYLFLIIAPLLGWLTLSAKGELDLPLGMHLWPLLGPDRSLGHTLQDIHEFIGNLGYYLIGLHAAAALFHHYVMRDDTLQRMLPKCARRLVARTIHAHPAGGR